VPGDPIRDAHARLEEAAKKHDSILMGFSGGKDSLVCLDLCTRYFKRIECFHMYLVPGLRVIDERLDVARQRWPEIPIHQLPHWVVFKFIYFGVYCDLRSKYDGWFDHKVQLRDIYDWLAAQTGIKLIASGARGKDSGWRRRNLKAISAYDDVLYPIVGWNVLEVLSYLKARNLPIPRSENRKASGVDLHHQYLTWCWDEFPDDFAKIEAYFPYVRASLYKEMWHGDWKPKRAAELRQVRSDRSPSVAAGPC